MRKEYSKNSTRKIKKTVGKTKSDRLKRITAIAIKHRNDENTQDLLESVDLESKAIQPDTTANWSQEQDRSEDLINETDPFIQAPGKTPNIPRDNKL